MSQVAKWEPVFPEPQPAHWVALVNTTTGVHVVADVTLQHEEREWLACWLSNYGVADPGLSASYLYLGLAVAWSGGSPDGRTWPLGVTGIGSGEGFGEPPGAVSSVIGDIVAQSVEVLRSGDF